MYLLQGQETYSNPFVLIYNTTQKVLILQNISMKKGPSPKNMATQGKNPANSLKYYENRNVVTFTLNFAGEVGVPQSEDSIPSIFTHKEGHSKALLCIM